MNRNTKKRITNTNDLIEFLNINLNEEEKELVNKFFKKKILHIRKNKIIYPKIQDIKKKKIEIEKKIKDLEKSIKFWDKNINKIERHNVLFPITMYLKKNFWRHKIKELTNKEYKKDVIETKLTDKILLDPEQNKLFETFLVNPDYRKKLKETVNTSIVYRHNNIGQHSDKKRKFRHKTYQLKIDNLNKQLIELKEQRKTYVKMYDIFNKNK